MAIDKTSKTDPEDSGRLNIKLTEDEKYRLAELLVEGLRKEIETESERYGR